MSTITKIFSTLTKTAKDYFVIWPQIIIFQIIARLIQLAVFGFFGLVSINYITENTDFTGSSNFDILQSVDPANLITLLFGFGILGLVAFFFEYHGIIHIADRYYSGSKISLWQTFNQIILSTPKFIRVVFIEIAVYLGIIGFAGLSSISIWTIFPEPFSYYLIAPLVGLFALLLWNSLIRLSYVNFRIFEDSKSIFGIFNYTLSKQQLIEGWITSALLVITTFGAIYLGSLSTRFILSLIPEISDSLRIISYLSSAVLSITLAISTILTGLYFSFFTLYLSRTYHQDFASIKSFPAGQHDYNYETWFQKFWNKNKIRILVAACVISITFIHFQAIQINQNLNNYLDQEFVTMAHRGGSAFAENSREVIQHSIDNDIDMVEVDVQVTSDSVPILYHDQTLSKVGMSNKVNLTPYSTIKQRTFPTGEKIISLQQLLEQTKDKIGLNIELKIYDDTREELVENVAKTLREYQTSKPVIITSLDYQVLELWQSQNTNYDTGLIITASIGDLGNYAVDWFIVNNIFYNTSEQEFRESGKKIALWSFNTNWDGSEAFEEGLDAGITDLPLELKNFVKTFESKPLDKQVEQSLIWSIN